MQRDSAVLRIFLRVIAQMLQANSPGAAHANKAALHIGAVAFIHRFGPSPNEHVHFHVCAVDGVLEAVVGEASEQGTRTTATRVMFHPATGIASKAVAHAQASLRRRILRAFVGRGLLEGFEAQEMLGYKHSGFSVATSVCIAAQDRAGLERLLRCCARRWCRHRVRTDTATAACWRPILRTGRRRWRWPQAEPQARARQSPSQAVCPQRWM